MQDQKEETRERRGWVSGHRSPCASCLLPSSPVCIRSECPCQERVIKRKQRRKNKGHKRKQRRNCRLFCKRQTDARLYTQVGVRMEHFEAQPDQHEECRLLFHLNRLSLPFLGKENVARPARFRQRILSHEQVKRRPAFRHSTHCLVPAADTKDRAADYYDYDTSGCRGKGTPTYAWDAVCKKRQTTGLKGRRTRAEETDKDSE